MKSLITILLVAGFLPLSAVAQTNFWQQTNGPFGGIVLSLAINSGGDLFAGADSYGGVYRSSDNGANWSQINTGLTYPYILSLAINSGGDLFAGTSGGGVFRSVEATCAVAKGDMDCDGGLTAADVVLLLNCVFLGSGSCFLSIVDGNCSGDLTAADVVLELYAVFQQRPFPC